MNNGKEIINKLVGFLNVSVNELSSKCGYERAQAFYDIQSGKTKRISANMANAIVSRYPELDINWLLTGHGNMLKDDDLQQVDDTASTGKLIPFYDAEAAAGTSYSMSMEPARPVGMIEIGSLLKDSEVALRVYGNSMVPNYPAGCVVGLRPHLDSFVEPGAVYVVETEDNRYLKRLYSNEDKSALRCISDNHMLQDSGPMKGEFFYPEFEIPFSSIRKLFRVVGVIKRNIL